MGVVCREKASAPAEISPYPSVLSTVRCCARVGGFCVEGHTSREASLTTKRKVNADCHACRVQQVGCCGTFHENANRKTVNLTYRWKEIGSSSLVHTPGRWYPLPSSATPCIPVDWNKADRLYVPPCRLLAPPATDSATPSAHHEGRYTLTPNPLDKTPLRGAQSSHHAPRVRM